MISRSLKLRAFAVLLLILAVAVPASASTITQNSVAQGWYQNDGPSNPGAGNFNVQWFMDVEVYRNYFVFDLTGVGAISSAALRLDTGGYLGDATETYTLFDVTTTIASLTAGTAGVAGFADLGSGTSYGSRVYSSADQNALRDVALNASGVAVISGTNGLFALGGALAASASSTKFIFGSGGPAAQLVVETASTPVPEPASLLLLGTGLGIAGVRRGWMWMKKRA